MTNTSQLMKLSISVQISEMIGCDGPDCVLEWFHFECVGIMVPPPGKWYCPQCSQRYGL